MHSYGSLFWKRTPFLKFLLPLMAGIIFQWNFPVAIADWCLLVILSLLFFCTFFFLPIFKRYRLSFITGIFSGVLFFALGAMLVWHHDIRNENYWFGNKYQPTDYLLVTLDEPPVEKTKSIKANATVNYLLHQSEAEPVSGKIIIYFQKDTTLPIDYGTQIIIKKKLQEIKNAGNPGGFDYKRYSLFQGITHQVFLKQEDIEILNTKKTGQFRTFLFACRQWVLNSLRSSIHGEKELGLAEALLIGYKDDLEQSLVQSYTNTGVVHIIAISGLHLGLIYWLLALLLQPLKKRKHISWLRPVLIITGLWLFSLLAGAQPSILRSAIMFTCIVLGESLSRKTSIYNTMAVSAFVLLCINPFWIWDVGFQLSYAAVLSIIIFMKPVYNWFYIKNKLLDAIWKLNAVTIAAQILTVPISIYHFHQFPNLFLLTNFLAVPLSSAILLGEILLCVLSFLPAITLLLGKIISWFIWLMNTYIERIESLTFSLWDGLQISIVQALLLLLFAIGTSIWLLEKLKPAIQFAFLSLVIFLGLRSYSFIQCQQQQKIIVYNVPQKRAIDFLNGRQYHFVGDSSLLTNDFARNFHLKPSRILHRVSEENEPHWLFMHENYLSFKGKYILLLDQPVSFASVPTRPVVDLLILSKNPRLYLNKLVTGLDIKQIVIDGSVPAWKANYWKKDCDSLKIPCHDVSVKGAFEMKIN